MFEDTNLFIGLDDEDPSTRLETVKKLRTSVGQAGGELPVHNLTQLFQLMSDRLKDDDNRVALMTAELVCDLLNRDLLTTDIYFPIILPAMFQNLAHVARRDSSVYVLTTYVEAMGGADCILEGLVQHGLMHDNPRVIEQTLWTLPTIVEGYLVPSASAGREDYMKLLDELVERLQGSDERILMAAGKALRFARSEDKNFAKHVEKLGHKAVEIVERVLSQEPKDPQSPGSPQWDVRGVVVLGDSSEKQDGTESRAPNFDTDIEKKYPGDSETKDSAAGSAATAGSTTQGLEEGKMRERNLLDGQSGKDPSDKLGSPSAHGLQSSESSPRDSASLNRNVNDELEIASNSLSSGTKGSKDQKSDASPTIAHNTLDGEREEEKELPKFKSGEVSDAQASDVHTAKPMKKGEVIEIPGNRMAELAVAAAKPSIESRAGDAYSEIHGSPRTAPVAGGVVRLVYGLISSPTMARLKDEGSWKARAAAIEDVLATVSDMSDADVRLVRPHIPELFEFLSSMLNDANFKISITTLHILEALVQKLGSLTRGSHANKLVKDLVQQLGANKAVVRQAALQVITSMLQVRLFLLPLRNV